MTKQALQFTVSIYSAVIVIIVVVVVVAIIILVIIVIVIIIIILRHLEQGSSGDLCVARVLLWA